jgi:hypothetical protein
MTEILDDPSIPIEAKIEIWRRKALDGTLTTAETAAAIRAMRAGRVGASATAKARATAKAPVDTSTLLAKLTALGLKNAGTT